MAVDLQVVFPQEAVKLTGVRIAEGTEVRSLDVSGDDFRSIDEVLINDVASPSFIVLSQSRMLAQVPDAVSLQAISSVRVTSRRLMLTERSHIRFRLGPSPGKVGGMLRLVQVFLRTLFTTPGSDIFSPNAGGSGLSNVGSTFSRDQGGDIVSDFILAVGLTQKQIVSTQGQDPSIPRDERLLAAKVIKASYNRNAATLIVSVELTSQAGQAATANVTL